MTPSTARALWLVFGPVASAFLGFAAFCLFVFGLGHYTDTDPRATSTEVFYRSMGFPALGATFIVGTLVSFWRAWRLSE